MDRWAWVDVELKSFWEISTRRLWTRSRKRSRRLEGKLFPSFPFPFASYTILTDLSPSTHIFYTPELSES
jgi:hypothetical protein